MVVSLTRFKSLLAGLAALAGLALLAPSAQADTEVFLSGSTMEVDGGVFQRQATEIRFSGNFVRVVEETSSGPRVDAGSGCVQVDNRTVDCPRSGVTQITVDDKNLDDHVEVEGQVTIRVIFLMGEGDDFFFGGGGSDKFVGLGLPGADGSDKVFGTGGIDSMDYSERSRPVTVSLDDIANDGQSSENDTVGSSVENVLGGSDRDTLIGSASNNELIGNEGNDDITGQGGADDLRGGGGDDTLRDDLDRVADRFDCGAGADQAFLDLIDARIAGFPRNSCEQIFASAIDQHPNLIIDVGRAEVMSPGGEVRLPLHCPRAQERGCTGEVTLRRGRTKLGSDRYSLRRGRRTTAVIQLSRAETARLKRLRRQEVEATALEKDPNGEPKTTIASFTLKAPPRRR